MTRPKERDGGAAAESVSRKARLQAQREIEAREAWADALKLRTAEAAKTARLRELRQAKEADDRAIAARTKAEKPKAPGGPRRRGT